MLIPEDNAKNLTRIFRNAIKGSLDIIPVSRMDEVIARALGAQARGH